MSRQESAAVVLIIGLAVAVLVLFFCASCDHSDRHGAPPGPKAEAGIRCFDWNGTGPPIDVALPVNRCEGHHLELCLLGDFQRDTLHRRRCYYDCPTSPYHDCGKRDEK